MRVAAGAALPRPLRRLGCGRPRGLVARRRCRHPGRVRPAYRPADRRERQGARLRARRTWWPARSPSTLARPPGAPYDVVFLDPPYPLDEAAVGSRPRAPDAAALAGPGRDGRGRALVAQPGADVAGRASRGSAASATARRRFGTVTPLRTQRTRRPDAPSRLPRVLRPGHQRAPRHRPACREPLRRGDRRGRRQRVEEAGSSRPRNACRCWSRGSSASGTSGSRGSPA